jgi:uncharacterized protein YjdB
MRLFRSVLLSLAFIAPRAEAQNVAEVQVTPETVTLKVGQKQALFAAAFDASGNLIPTARFTFGSNNPAVAQAQPDGVVIGLKAGAAIVQVTAGQKSFSVAVSVESPGEQRSTEAAATRPPPQPTGPPASVLTIEPTPVYLLPSENRRLMVKAFRDDGSPADATRVTWRSLTPEVVTVDADGNVVGLSAGTAIVQVSVAGGLAATAPVEVAAGEFTAIPVRMVLAPQDLDTIGVTVASQGNRELRSGLQWRSSAPEIMRVGPTGIVQALAPGEAEVIISGFFQERRIPVRVHPPVQTLVVSPRPSAGVIRVPLRGTRALTVRAEAADSTPVPEATLGWEVGDTTLVNYDPARGEITARGLGTTSITLRARGFDPISWVIEVIPGGIALERIRYPLILGERITLAPSLVDESGAPLAPATELTWATENSNVAVVGNDGIVQATGFGRARLTATTKWGRSTTADIYVLGDVVFSANRGGPTFGLYQLAAKDPTRIVPILADSFQNVQPAVSPDRLSIAFSSNRRGDFDLYLMDADGENLRQLTTQAGPDGDPVWSPDGTRIIFSATRNGATHIFSISADGSGLRQLTTAGGGNTAPAVSPDGRTIAFVSGRDGNDEIYRMDLDGSNQANLSNTKEKESSPHFFPDGDLAWAREVRRSGWQIARMAGTDTTGADVLLVEQHPITSFGVSRDGQRLAVVAGRITDRGRGRAEFSFSLVSLGGAPFMVPLVANEQVVKPSF